MKGPIRAESSCAPSRRLGRPAAALLEVESWSGPLLGDCLRLAQCAFSMACAERARESTRFELGRVARRLERGGGQSSAACAARPLCASEPSGGQATAAAATMEVRPAAAVATSETAFRLVV